MNFETYLSSLPLNAKQTHILKEFYHNYERAGMSNGYTQQELLHQFKQLTQFVLEENNHPYQFQPYHKALFSPINYYQFGLDFMKVLVTGITLKGNVQQIQEKLSSGDNVILLANHQTEADPQFISLALEKTFPKIAQQMIFVAGERVVTDPLAIPFSKGRYLLCIYSKRYIDIPPQQKLQKQLHNKKTMEQMAELLKEGRKIIYVAPSGGRDRKDEQGTIQIAPFDPQSIEMFILMAKRAQTPTHFHTLALATYDLLPPPENIQTELGEKRLCHKGNIGFYFGDAIDLEKYAHLGDKHITRQKRAEELSETVKAHYRALV